MPTMHLAGRDIPVIVELMTDGDDTYVKQVTILGGDLPAYIEYHLCEQEMDRQRAESIDILEPYQDASGRSQLMSQK